MLSDRPRWTSQRFVIAIATIFLLILTVLSSSVEDGAESSNIQETV